MRKTASQIGDEVLEKVALSISAIEKAYYGNPRVAITPLAERAEKFQAKRLMRKAQGFIQEGNYSNEAVNRSGLFRHNPLGSGYVRNFPLDKGYGEGLREVTDEFAKKRGIHDLKSRRLKISSQIADVVLKKLAEGELLDESYYEDTPAKKRHWPYAAAGALAGGAAAHYLAPSQMVKDYRETAKGLEGASQASQEAFKPHYDPKAQTTEGPGKFTNVPKETWDTHKRLVKDVNVQGRRVGFEAPAHAAQKYFKTRAWQEAMPRNLLGAGLGLGAGLLGSSMLS